MGATLGSGTFEVPRTEAGACTECRVGYKAPRPESGVDYWLDIVYRLKEDKPYALRGFEAGRYQFALPAAAPVRAAAARSAVVSRTERSVTLTAGSVTATVGICGAGLRADAESARTEFLAGIHRQRPPGLAYAGAHGRMAHDA